MACSTDQCWKCHVEWTLPPVVSELRSLRDRALQVFELRAQRRTGAMRRERTA